MGLKKGTRLKADKDLHRHQLWAKFTDEQFDKICRCTAEYDLSFGRMMRILTLIALEDDDLDGKIVRRLLKAE